MLPGRLGYGADLTQRTTKTQIMSVLYYAVGGFVAGLVYQNLADD